MINYDPRVFSEIFLKSSYEPPTHNNINFYLDKILIDIIGDGYLAGTYPDGITSIKKVPISADITVTIRGRHKSLLDNVVIATTTSGQDGTWIIPNLRKDLGFNVIARKSGHKDVLVSNVKAF